MLHTARLNYGQPSPAQPCGGWEAPGSEVRGHNTGHLMSALALTFASTGNAAARARGRYLVSQLAALQALARPTGFYRGYLSAFPESLFDRLESGQWVWSPYYMIHKYLAGLIDQYPLAGDGQTLEVAAGLADRVDWRTSRLSYARMLMVLENEYGALPEALADLYAITGTERYLAAAQRFYHARVLDALAAGEDVLPRLQCNVTVPKIISCVRLWEETGNRKYRDIALNFWRLITGHYTYVIGGSGNYEHWHAPDVAAGQLSNRTGEGCVTYHLLKLTRLLHFHDQERTDLLDYYERALFNQMLGTQTRTPRTGSTSTTPGCPRARSSSSRRTISPAATRTCTPPTTPISPATTRPEWRRRRSSPTRSTPVTPAAALRYRASSSGAPARNWITAPSGATGPPAPSARLLPGRAGSAAPG